MATESSGDPIASFLESARIDIDDLGEPPLADTEDPLLDRDRIHLDLED